MDNNLTSIILPNSVTSISHASFSNNNLTNIVIPNSVTSIYGIPFTTNPITSIIIKRADSTGMTLSENWNCIDFNYNDNTCNKYIEPQYIP